VEAPDKLGLQIDHDIMLPREVYSNVPEPYTIETIPDKKLLTKKIAYDDYKDIFDFS